MDEKAAAVGCLYYSSCGLDIFEMCFEVGEELFGCVAYEVYRKVLVDKYVQCLWDIVGNGELGLWLWLFDGEKLCLVEENHGEW